MRWEEQARTARWGGWEGQTVAVLADSQIRRLIKIEPFEEARKRPGKVSFGLSSYGYDVRVGTKFKIFTPTPRHGGTTIVEISNTAIDGYPAASDRCVRPAVEQDEATADTKATAGAGGCCAAQ